MPVPNVQPVPQLARKPQLPALTGIRTLLACNIVLFHFTPSHTGYADPFIQNGFVFVGFFFLLSGYVLAYNYAERALTLNARHFWVARFARLYPVYLLALLLSAHMLRLEWYARPRTEFWQGIVLTPLLLQAWSPSLATFWNTVGWTLSAELLLYAAFPWIIRKWHLWLSESDTSIRHIAIFAGLWLLGMVPHSCYLLLNPDHLPQPITRYSYGLWLRALKYSPASYICMFLAGIALGQLQLVLKITPRQREVLAVVGVVATGVFFFTAVSRVPYVLLHGGLLLPLFAFLILGLSGKNAIASVLQFRPLLLVGESTFCVYMLHFNGINLMQENHIWDRLRISSLDPWISYATILLFSLAVHHAVEKPARRFLLGRLLQTSQATPKA